MSTRSPCDPRPSSHPLCGVTNLRPLCGLLAPTYSPGVSMPAKKVAAVVTEYRKWSHADVILRNLLDGYPDGTKPGLELVSLFTDQVPKGDMSRDLAKKHGFKIYDTIADCLTLGGKTLAVDAVLSIGEHGKYPKNEKGQI